jgi:hypothetical protein
VCKYAVGIFFGRGGGIWGGSRYMGYMHVSACMCRNLSVYYRYFTAVSILLPSATHACTSGTCRNVKM